MESKYTSNRNIAGVPTIPIATDDPRLSWHQRALTKSTIGGPIDEIGLDGKPLNAGGTNFYSPSGASNINTSSSGSNFTVPFGGGPAIDIGFGQILPTSVTDIQASWSNEDLVVTFNWDYDDPLNATITEFVLEVTADGITRQTPYGSFIPNKTQTNQTLTLTKSLNRSTIGVFRTSITSICVYAIDSFYNKSASVCDNSIPLYVLSLPIPDITVTAAISGYNVSFTVPTESVFDAIDIVEYESNASIEPTGVDYSRVYFNSISHASIITINTNSRWVKARFSSDGGTYTAFSAAQKITPISPVSMDTTGPENVISVSATTGVDTSGYLGFNAYADITWPAVVDSTLRGYRIRFSNDNGTTYSYANSPGTGTTYRLGGLAIGSTYKIAVATYDELNNTSSNYISVSPDVTIAGTPSVSNYITAGPFQFGVGVGNVSTNKGLYFDASNYWYINATNSARLKVGGSTSNYLQWDGSTFVIDGNITARGGYFAGNVEIISGGSIYSGTVSGGSLSGAGYILNSTGLKFNSSTINDITTINGSTGLFTTASALIGGWSVTSNKISKTQSNQGTISLDSANGYISISNDGIANQTAGINSPSASTDVSFWSGALATNGVSSAAQLADAPFRVNLAGDLFASNAIIKGTVRAGGGGFGTFSGNSVSKGWEIDESGLIGVGLAKIVINTGRITVGGYSVRTIDGTDFSIYDDTTNTPVLRTDLVVGATSDPRRLFLGDASRHVEVARSAALSGVGTTESVPSTNAAVLSAYRSGGLRNIYTVASGQLSVDGSGNILEYPTSLKGDMLVVYNPSLPTSNSTYPWRQITGIYINTKGGDAIAPLNTVAPVITEIGNKQYSSTTGTWESDITPIYTYQWKYNDQGSLWLNIPEEYATGGNVTSSTISLTSSNLDGLGIRCYVTATISGAFTTAYSNSIIISSVTTTTTTTVAPGAPSGGSVSLTGGSTPGSTITALTSGWSGSPTSYSVVIRAAVSPNIPTESNTIVAFSINSDSCSYTIEQNDINPVRIFKAFALATNNDGNSATVSSGTITATVGTTTTSAPVTYYQGYSACNANAGCYISAPSVSGPFTAASIPSDPALIGPSTAREKIVYRSTLSAALADAAQASCVVCSTTTTTTAAPATTTTTTTTTTTAAPTTTTTAAPVQYTINWNANGGTVTPTSTVVTQGSSVTAPTPTRSGYTFSHWRNPPSGDLLYIYYADSVFTPTESFTLTAIWTLNPTAAPATTTTASPTTTTAAPTTTTAAPATTTTAGPVYYTGYSSCNANSGIYISAPSVSGPYPGSPPTDITTGPSTAREWFRYRTTSSAALSAASQPSCSSSPTAAPTAAPTTTAAPSANRICTQLDYQNLPLGQCNYAGACDPYGSDVSC